MTKLNAYEAEALSGYGRTTVYEAARSGRLKAKRIGRYWEFDEDEVRRWASDPYSHKNEFPAPEGYLTMAEAIDMSGRGESTFRSWIRDGYIETIKAKNSRRFVEVKSLKEWLEVIR